MLSKMRSGELNPVLTEQPIVVDLQMSDTEYLELLAQGRDPVREQFYARELIAYGYTLAEAQRFAPLFDKPNCSIAERIMISRVLKQIWKRLLRSAALDRSKSIAQKSA